MMSILEADNTELELFKKCMSIRDYTILVSLQKSYISVVEDENGILHNSIRLESLDEYPLNHIETHLQVQGRFFYLNFKSAVENGDTSTIFAKLRSTYDDVLDRATLLAKNGEPNDFVFKIDLVKEEETDEPLINHAYCMSFITPVFCTIEMINGENVATLVYEHSNVRFDETDVDNVEMYNEENYAIQEEIARLSKETGLDLDKLTDYQLERLLQGKSPFMNDEEEEQYNKQKLEEEVSSQIEEEIKLDEASDNSNVSELEEYADFGFDNISEQFTDISAKNSDDD